MQLYQMKTYEKNLCGWEKIPPPPHKIRLIDIRLYTGEKMANNQSKKKHYIQKYQYVYKNFDFFKAV